MAFLEQQRNVPQKRASDTRFVKKGIVTTSIFPTASSTYSMLNYVDLFCRWSRRRWWSGWGTECIRRYVFRRLGGL